MRADDLALVTASGLLLLALAVTVAWAFPSWLPALGMVAAIGAMDRATGTARATWGWVACAAGSVTIAALLLVS